MNIDGSKGGWSIRLQRRPKRLVAGVLVYALPLLIALYGLKCLLGLDGHLPVRERYAPRYTFQLKAVNAGAAVLAGLGYMALGLFGALSTGSPPPQNRKWTWRIARG